MKPKSTFVESSRVGTSSCRAKTMLAFRLIVILLVTFSSWIAAGCSQNSKDGRQENSENATSKQVKFESILEQVNKSHVFREEILASFDQESKQENLRFLRERAKQEQLAMHLRTSVKEVQEHMEFVKTAKRFSDRFTVLSVDERLEVAKLAESVLSKSDDEMRQEAIVAAIKRRDEIEEERELHSSSRNKEKKAMKKAANLENPEFQAAFQPLVQEQAAQEFGFFSDEIAGDFCESMANFQFKDEDGKRLRLGISLQLEAPKYVNESGIKKRDQYRVLADSKSKLVLETGRLFIVLSTEAELEEGELWEFFKGVTEDEQMQRLADELNKKK